MLDSGFLMIEQVKSDALFSLVDLTYLNSLFGFMKCYSMIGLLFLIHCRCILYEWS